MRAISVLVLLCGATALAENPYLVQARENLKRFEYDRCLSRLEQANTWKDSSPQELSEIEVVAGVCEANLGRNQAAVERFTMALKLDAAAQLPALTSPKIHELFKRAQARSAPPSTPVVAEAQPVEVQPEPRVETPAETPAETPPITDAPVKEEPKLTPEPAQAPTVVAEQPRALKRIPDATWILGGVAVVGAVTGVVQGVRVLENQTFAADSPFVSERYAALQQARSDAVVANVAFGVATAALVAAVIVAIVNQVSP